MPHADSGLAWRLSPSAPYAHAVVSVLTPAVTLMAARRLAGAGPRLPAVAGLVHREDLWQLYRDELNGAGVLYGVRMCSSPGIALIAWDRQAGGGQFGDDVPVPGRGQVMRFTIASACGDDAPPSMKKWLSEPDRAAPYR